MTDRPVDLSFLKDEAVKYIDLSSLRIANCVGCFGCWTKTPVMCSIVLCKVKKATSFQI